MTKCDESLHRLSSSQVAALGVLFSGGTHEDAARAAGVHRVTVTRWANHHPAFIAEHNRFRVDLQEILRLKMERASGSALDVVQGALERGDVGVALRWLQLVCPLRQPAPGPTDSRDVVEVVRLGMRPPLLADAEALGLEHNRDDAERWIRQRLSE